MWLTALVMTEAGIITAYLINIQMMSVFLQLAYRITRWSRPLE